MKRYPERAIWEEIAYLAHHLHWGLSDLLDLEHRQRDRLVRTVADLGLDRNDSTQHA